MDDLSYELSVREAAALQADPSVVFIDVREDEELAICSIAGALHLPLSNFGVTYEHLPKGGRMVVFCHHGMRSLHATQFLRARGFDGAQSMAGGIDAWAVECAPYMSRY